MRKNIGLTGGIGAGKSAVAARLASRGAVVIDADVLAREALEPGTAEYSAVVKLFGKDVCDETGAINRSRLAGYVFGDPKKLGKLNAIVHPAVRARANEIAENTSPHAIVVQDIPLLVESGLADLFDLVVVVEAPLEQRYERMRNKGMRDSDIAARIARQATDEQRRAVADVVVQNNGTWEELDRQVEQLWASLVAANK